MARHSREVGVSEIETEQTELGQVFVVTSYFTNAVKRPNVVPSDRCYNFSELQVRSATEVINQAISENRKPEWLLYGFGKVYLSGCSAGQKTRFSIAQPLSRARRKIPGVSFNVKPRPAIPSDASAPSLVGKLRIEP